MTKKNAAKTAARRVKAESGGKYTQLLREAQAATQVPKPPTVLDLLFEGCKMQGIAPQAHFADLEEFRLYVLGRALSKHAQARPEQRYWIDEAIKTATSGDLAATSANIKRAGLVAGPSLSEQLSEALSGILKPSPFDQLARGLGESFKVSRSMFSASQALKATILPETLNNLENPLEGIGGLKIENPLHQLGKLNVSSQIAAQKMDLTSAMQSLRVPKIQTTADLFKDIIPPNPIVEQQRQLREMMFGPMDRIKAAIKASRPKRVRKPRPKKPPTQTPSAD